MDLAAGAENERAHLGIPVARLVAEMDAGFQHLAHGDLGHDYFLKKMEPCRLRDILAPGLGLHLTAVSNLDLEPVRAPRDGG